MAQLGDRIVFLSDGAEVDKSAPGFLFPTLLLALSLLLGLGDGYRFIRLICRLLFRVFFLDFLAELEWGSPVGNESNLKSLISHFLRAWPHLNRG